MFIDDIKNRYTYLNSMKNIVHEEALDRPEYPNREIIIHTALPAVLDRLMKERPTWRYKSIQPLYGSSARANEFIIYDNDEELGKLWIETHWRDETIRYFFDNFRLKQTRQRHMPTFSTKPDVAAKRIVKAFHLKTPKERAADAFKETHPIINGIAADVSWPFRRAKSALEDKLFDYAARNWETIKHHLGVDTTNLDLPALAEAYDEGGRMNTAYANNEGVTVRIEANGAYLVSRKDANGAIDAVTHTDASLTDHLRGALGLLKLMDVKGYIDGVGVRVNTNLYFVMDKKAEE
jgi:hypothetical protein